MLGTPRAVKLLRLVATAVAVSVAFACSAGDPAEPEEPAQPVEPPPAPQAAAVAQAPAPAAPAPAPRTAPFKPQPAASTATAHCFIRGEQVTDCPRRSPHRWRSDPTPPGVYWGYHAYEGPIPTEFYESPMSYELVKAGKLPPIEERVPKDVKVVQGPDDIGEYGGTYRLTAHFLLLGEFSPGNWYERDSNGVDWRPHVGRRFEISPDGRAYTMTLRDGLRYSDGSPFTMEDVRFAWEELNFNTELRPIIPQAYRDPVTDRPASFRVLDDLNWSLTFDTPVYNLFELSSDRGDQCGEAMCFFSPPYMKQFHPSHASPVELRAMGTRNKVEGWVQLFKLKDDWETNTERPCARAWCVTSNSDAERVATRNHYSFTLDPEGNQLPYIDEVQMLKMESREVAVFRAMAGENDGQTALYRIQELPLYVSRMGRGDYSLYHWPSPGGNDAAISLNQTWNEDQETGRWLRTRDFRRALSMAINREAIDDTVFLGTGVVQNWVPHPGTLFYPGDDYASLDVRYDPEEANRLLDSLGLSARNGEGFRLRTDGSGEPLVLKAVIGNDESVPIMELVEDDWSDVGITLNFRVSKGWWRLIGRNDEYMGVGIDYSARQANPWTVGWTRQVPVRSSSYTAQQIGLWVETRGREGMGTTGPDPGFLPLAPGGTFPADPSGNQKRLIGLWQDGKAHPMYSPDRAEMGKQIFEINTEELYAIPTVGFTGSRRGIFLNRNNVRNQPVTHVRDHYGFAAWTYYFEGGRDNVHHAGNRSSRESLSFVERR